MPTSQEEEGNQGVIHACNVGKQFQWKTMENLPALKLRFHMCLCLYFAKCFIIPSLQYGPTQWETQVYTTAAISGVGEMPLWTLYQV